MRRLSPHVVIESMSERRQDINEWFRADGVEAVLRMLHGVVLFDMSAVEPVEEHYSFGFDLYERGLFGLPFERVAFTFMGMGGKRGPPRPVLVVLEGQPGAAALSGVVCDSNPIAGNGYPIAMFKDAVCGTHTPDGVRGNYIELSLRLVPRPATICQMTGSANIDDGVSIFKYITQLLVGEAIARNVMLMSSGLTVDREGAPERLNKARVRKGKPPIGDLYTVRLDPLRARIIHTEGNDEDITGHVRGSPRPHWRRGHFRTIHRGDEGERVVPVAPALIGVGESEVARPMYELARKGSAAPVPSLTERG